MAEQSPSEVSPGGKGSRPPLLEAFGITGLHGYRTISLQTDHAATILIAKNGSGKTTLLGVLNAFLKGQFHRLRGLEFDSVFCKFRGMPDQLILSRSDLDDALAQPETGEFVSIANRIGISANLLLKFIREEWPSLQSSSENAYENTVYSALGREYGFSGLALEKAIADLHQLSYEKNPNVSHILQATKTALQGFEILYLPTYRRVELALRGDAEPRHRRKRPRIDVASGGLFTGDIQFGLSDISDRLSDLNEKIVHQSNSQYRKISADIINGLIDGSFDDHNIQTGGIPSRDDLELLFSRVEQSRRFGPHYPVTIPNIEKIYSEEGVPESTEKFLTYFLNQLNKVIESTKEVEVRVQEFVNICNKYLSSDDASAQIATSSGQHIFDGKRLVLSRRSLQVQVISVPEGRRIVLDALSSGEKQMISLFAKLFLYENPKIVLIDEPELSLSIDWQRQILVDVVNSPLCQQMIAITHSPFVFDNELDGYAGSLKVSTTSAGAPFADSESSFGDDAFDE